MADPFAELTGQAATPQDAGADFLTSEQNEIAALENQLLNSDINEQQPADGTTDFFGTDTTTNQEASNGFELVNGDGMAVAATGGDSDIDILAEDTNVIENNFTEPQCNGLEEFAGAASAMPVMEAAPVSSSPVVSMSAPAYDISIEPESIRTWREEFNRRIQEADAKEAAAKQEWLAQAKKEMEEWQRQRDDTLEKTKAANREAEKAFIEERESREEEGKSRGDVQDIDWTHTADLCDFNPKSSKGSKDTSRMRSLFLHLKEKK